MLERRVLDFFTGICSTRPDDTLMVAVSGGPDSVALLYLLLQVRDTLGVRLEVAHLDHGLRGKEAQEDARFVSTLAEREGLTLHQRRVDIPAMLEAQGGSAEAVARRERYTFLDEARSVAGARWIVTGHTADDQVETFLMNLLRGAGPRGLGGMLPVGPGPMCRPLLGAWKEQILAFLEENDLEYRTDTTNADLALTRNRLRHQVVPILEREFGPGALRTVARESQLMNELDDFLSLEADHILQELAREETDVSGWAEIHLEVPRLATYHRVLQRSAIRAALEKLGGDLQDLTLAHVDSVLELIDRQNGSAEVSLSRDRIARREYDSLVLGWLPESASDLVVPEASPPLDLERPGELRWGRLHLRWSFVGADELERTDWAGHPERSCFARTATVPPVYLRAMRPGDRLEPQGMEGRQKLSDLLINRKVPRRLRTWIPLLCDNGGPEDGERILWVVGQRRSRYAQMDPGPADVVLFEAETIV